MAKRELSSRLSQMKFMQRSKAREEETPCPDPNLDPDPPRHEADDEHWMASAASSHRPLSSLCMVIMEGDPSPGAVVGRMSFGNFNPAIEKLAQEEEDPSEREASGNDEKADPPPHSSSSPPPRPHAKALSTQAEGKRKDVERRGNGQRRGKEEQAALGRQEDSLSGSLKRQAGREEGDGQGQGKKGRLLGAPRDTDSGERSTSGISSARVPSNDWRKLRPLPKGQ